MNLWKFVEQCRQWAEVWLFLSQGALQNFFIVPCCKAAACKVLQTGAQIVAQSWEEEKLLNCSRQAFFPDRIFFTLKK